MASLTLHYGGRIAPVICELAGDVITIGRLPSNNVVIDDPTVSMQHASLTKSPSGYRLTDLGSTNGTQYNGVLITGAELKDGDEIRFGSVAAVFRDAAGANAVQNEQLETSISHHLTTPAVRRSRTLTGLASLGRGVGMWLLGVLFLGVLLFLVGIILGWGARLAALMEPWVQGLAGLALLILVPISLLLLIFRKTRGYGGIGIYFASYPVGLALWIGCLLYAVGVSVFWTIAGILMGGLGIVPVAAIMTLIRRDWSSFGGIIGTVVVVFVLRGFGAWIGEKSEQWNAEATSRAEAARESAARRGNYFARHWRGQLSLGVSYWVNGFLVSLLVGLATSTVTEIQETMSLKMLCALSLLFYAAAVITSLWWSVGVWRSASNHFSRGGTRFLAGVAKVIVILGLLSTFALIWRTYIPQSVELISIIAGDARMPPYDIRVLPGGTEIEFRGGLRAGCAKELERIFSAVPQTKVLHIESPGGRIGEAREMMKLVRDRELVTYTSEQCQSAATLVLMAGKERVIAANAKVGFHAGSFPGMTAEQQGEMSDVLRSTLQSAGVSEKFIERVLATPPDQMWYPTLKEMLEARVVTSQSLAGRFVDSLGPRGSNKQFANVLRTFSKDVENYGESGGIDKIPAFKRTGDPASDQILQLLSEFYQSAVPVLADMGSKLGDLETKDDAFKGVVTSKASLKAQLETEVRKQIESERVIQKTRSDLARTVNAFLQNVTLPNVSTQQREQIRQGLEDGIKTTFDPQCETMFTLLERKAKAKLEAFEFLVAACDYTEFKEGKTGANALLFSTATRQRIDELLKRADSAAEEVTAFQKKQSENTKTKLDQLGR